MINSKIVDDWKAAHYIAYLYLAVADADNDTTEDELSMSKRKVKVILNEFYANDGVNHEQIVDEVRNEIKHHLDNEKTDIINELSKKYKLAEDAKRDIISDLTDLIESDDKVQAAEHYMLSFLRLVLSKN